MAKRTYSEETWRKIKDYKIAYNSAHYKTYTCRLNLDTDKDVINQIYAQENSTEYIRDLVRADIAKQKKKKK